jgi:hypothetical protein
LRVRKPAILSFEAARNGTEGRNVRPSSFVGLLRDVEVRVRHGEKIGKICCGLEISELTLVKQTLKEAFRR